MSEPVGHSSEGFAAASDLQAASLEAQLSNALARLNELERVNEQLIERQGAFVWYQRLELTRAREKHPPIVSLHAAYSIILEELEEFWDQVKRKEALRDVPVMVEELTQIAAMCQRTFEDLKLHERYRPR